MEVLGVWEGQGWLAKVVKDAWKLHFLTIVPQSMGMILQAWDNYQVTLLDHSILSNKGYSTIYIVYQGLTWCLFGLDLGLTAHISIYL